MQFFTTAIALLSVAASLVNAAPNPRAPAACKTILLTNDDGWAATNVRATYYKLKEAGYKVYMVAPVSQRSGFGGKFDIPTSPTLETDGGFNYPPAGAASWGYEEADDHMWYFNGTPASCVAFGLTYLPQFFNKSIKYDLVVSGPNEGTNLSPGMFTLSGTIGAAYNAAYRGIPSVAFSGSNENGTFFQSDLDLDDPMSPPTIYATKITEFVDELLNGYGRALPLGTGINVNFPNVGYLDESCTDPKWVNTRLTGDYASGGDLSYDKESNSFAWTQSSWDALEICESGDCKLPSENYIVEHTKCAASVSVFSIDYDADYYLSKKVQQAIGDLFK
ncbi:Acid phosphatase [Spathaspora sp. JA1]|nr:Acid phosphatase [Spathaspora sp. JA1]